MWNGLSLSYVFDNENQIVNTSSRAESVTDSRHHIETDVKATQ